MAGTFDDLVPGAAGGGLFDDLTPQAPTAGERIGAGILSGLSGAMRAVKAPADLVNTLAPNPLTQGASDFFQRGIDAARDVAPDSIKAQRERPILTRFADGDVDFQLPNATQVVDVLAESAPLIPGLLASGQAISRLPQALGAGKGLSQAIGFGAANAAFVAPSAGDEVRREALERGDTEEQARDAQLTAAGLMTPISALTGGAGLSLAARLGAGRGAISGAVRGFVADAPFEGIEEGAESAVQDVALGRAVDPIRAGSAAALGAIAGGLPGAAVGALEGAANAPRDPIDPSKPAGPIVRAALAAPALVPQTDPKAAAEEQRRADAADQNAASVYASREAEELRRQQAYQDLGIYDPLIGADLPPTGGIEVQEVGSFDDLIPPQPKQEPPSTKGIQVREAGEKDIEEAGGETITLAEDKPPRPGSLQVGTAKPSELAPAEREAYDRFTAEREQEAAAAREQETQARAAADLARREAQRNQPEIRADNGEPFKTVPAANAARKKLEAPDDYEVKRLDKGQFVLARKANEQAQQPAAEVAAASDGREGGDAPRGDARDAVDADGPVAGRPGGDATGTGRGDAAAIPVGDRAGEPAAALTEPSDVQEPVAPAGAAAPAGTERPAAADQPQGAPPAEVPAPPVARAETIRRDDGTPFPTAIAANQERTRIPEPERGQYRVQKVDGGFEVTRTPVAPPATPNTPESAAVPEAGAASTPSGQAGTTPAVDAAPASAAPAPEQPAQAQGGEPSEGAGSAQPTPAPEATVKDSLPVQPATDPVYPTKLKAGAARAKAGQKETHDIVPVEGGFGVRAKAVVAENATTAPQREESASPEWASFDKDSGSLNIPRADMPQIKAEHRGALTQFLKGKGIEHTTEEVDAKSLKPTQAEFSPTKVAKAKAYEGGERSIIVSSDNHVVDGHHQWLAKRDAGEPIKVIRLDKPIAELLPVVKEFPSAEASAGAETRKARRAQPGEPGYTLDDARADLKQLKDTAAELLEQSGRISDDRLNERIRQQERIVREMESAAAPKSATTANEDSKAQPDQKTAPKPSGNTIFTEEAATKARERIRAKLNQTRLGSGVDPELMFDGIILAGYHIEKGARTFAAYARAMVADMGDGIKPYLKSWYVAVKLDPRAQGFEGMTPLAEVESAVVDDLIANPQENADERADQQGVGEVDPAGVPAAEEGRDAPAQQPAARLDPESVGDGQPEDVGSPESSGPNGAAGVRAPGTDVEAQGGADGSGDARNRRPRNGRARNPDAGAGGSGAAGQRDGGNGRAGVLVDGEQGDGQGVPEPVDPATVSPANTGPGDFYIEDPLKIVGGGQVARFEKNKAAITLRNRLIDEGRQPTREEQATLAGYTGWGSFGQELFQGNWNKPAPKAGWEVRDQWLRDNLGQKEWEGMQTSIINAHYTDPPTVLAMWDMVKRMGFTGGRVLEPSIGIGNFFGMMPPALASRSQRAGIELDPVTGSMAQLLYPNANIQIKGYEESKTPDNFYDLVIGNWPFFEEGPADRRYAKLAPTLHDYFFLKAIDQTRPGGLVVGITSKGTMDKKGVNARMEMARKAELVAAFRLPSGAFEEYAGTKVVTDIIILRKRETPVSIVSGEGWIDVKDHPTPEGSPVSVNEYFHRNPSHVIGTIDFGSGTTFNRPGLIVKRPDDMAAQLRRIVDLVPQGAFKADQAGKRITYVANHTSDRTNALVQTDKGFFVVQGEYLAPANEIHKYELKSPEATRKREQQFSALIDMRKLYGALIDAERTGDAEAQRTALNASYQAFVKANGPLSQSFGLSYLEKIDDPFYPSLAALESKRDGKFVPAGILLGSTMRGRKGIDNPSVPDAYVLARNESVNPTPERIAELAKRPTDEVRRELIESGAAFDAPNGDFVPSDLYLSGNVREKMRQARAALEAGNAAMQRNVEALEKVIPADIPYYKIETQMGATWVPARAYSDYIAHMLGMSSSNAIEVKFHAGAWQVQFPGGLNDRTEASSGFGTPHVKFKKLVRAAIGNQTITVRKRDSDGTEYVDETATKETNAKIADMRLKFGEWLWSDPERRTAMEAEYNEVRNAYATPKFDGSFLGFEGMALTLGRGPFSLRQHQANAIWRALVTRKSLNAHEVGTGKTFTIGGIAVESRRYGIAKKPLLFAHNANSKSVAHEIQMMYPAARVLYIDNLSKENIRVRLRQIANDDWDVVVMPHSVMDRLGFKRDTLMAMAKEEIADLEIAAEEAAEEDGTKIEPGMWDDEEELNKLRSVTAKQLVKQRLKIIQKIDLMAQRASREDSIPFEDLGVDMVMVDEAHEFKKPPIATRMKMKGLQTQTSDRSIALSFITRYIRGQNGGTNVHLFTGTPITNTMTEVFHMMRYMMQEEMSASGLADWDGWFGSFAREVGDVELTSTGDYEAVTRLQAFINVPELRRMVGQYMDVVFADDMPEMQPREVGGKRLTDKDLTEAQRADILNGRTEGAMDRPYKRVVNQSADMSAEQMAVFERVQRLARAWRQMTKKARKEAMTAGAPEVPIIHDGIAERASFDVRLVNGIQNAGKEGSPELEPHPDSKPARVVRNLLEIYRSNALATQAVFMEQGLSKNVTRSEGPVGAKKKVTYPSFSTVRDMIERLVQAGIPREQIAVVDGSTSKDKRKEVADAMNAGTIRIVFGSSDSLGVGVNMQRNLRAMHHMDAPWMPGELEQRNGRGHRQGNQWNTVLEYRYLTDRLDGRRWQVLAIKQRFINEFMKSKGEARVIEGDAAADEQSDIVSTFADAAGDPRVLVREKVKKKLDLMQSRERMHSQAQAEALRSVRRERESVASAEKELERVREAGTRDKVTALIDGMRGDGFRAVINGESFAARKDAAEYLRKWLPEELRLGDKKEIGTYGDQTLYGQWGRFDDAPSVYILIDDEKLFSNGPSIPSLDSVLRDYRDSVESRYERSIERSKQKIKHAEAVAAEPFHMAEQLAALKKQLSDLERDIEMNPVAPPFWLRSGAPIDTEVFRDGKPFVVTGHRWNDSGWYVLATDERGEVAIPYSEAQDVQGMPIYEPREFASPKVITKNADKPGDGQFALADDFGTSTVDDVRAKLDATFGRKGIQNLIDKGALVIVPDVRALPAGLREQALATGQRVKGVYTRDSGTAYMVASNLNPDEVVTNLLHEIGEHRGLKALMGAEAYAGLIAQVKGLAKTNPVVKQAYDTVKRLYTKLSESDEQFWREVIAKSAEQPAVLTQSWFKTLIQAVRRWLFKNGWMAMKLTDQDIAGMVAASLRAQMRDGGKKSGEVLSTTPAMASLSPMKGEVVDLGFTLPNGSRFAVVRKRKNVGEDHAYFRTREEAERYRDGQSLKANRAFGPDDAWAADQAGQDGDAGGRGSKSRLELTLARRASSSFRSGKAALDAQTAGTLAQDPARAGYCYKLSAEASAAGLGDFVIGRTGDGAGNTIWHAVVQTADGATYDATMRAWFEPGVYEGLGFRPALRMTTQQVRDFIYDSRGLVPDARNQNLGEPDEGQFALADAMPQVHQRVADLFETRKTFNWWHSTIGTQYGKAQKDKDFKRVFDRGQAYLHDVARLALGAADLAPDILPKLERLSDIVKSGASPRDLKPVADAIFLGTLEDEKVYSSDELASKFKLNPKQIRLYRQARAAIDRSLEDVGVTDMVKLARADLTEAQAKRAAAQPNTGAALAYLSQQIAGNEPLIAQLQQKAERVADLRAKGYAPLMRFGRYSVSQTDAAGNQLYFGLFEDEADARKMERELAEDKNTRVERGVMSQEAFKLFKGISPDTLELFANVTGASENAMFQEYLKLAINNRSALKRLIRRKGIAGYNPDLKRVLAQFITSNARAGSGNLHRGEMLKAANDIPREKGDVKDEAVKLLGFVQDPQEEASGLRSFLFFNFLGGSVASAAVNMTQPITMTLPYLAQWGAARAAKEIKAAVAPGLHRPIREPALRAAMDRAIKDGVVEPHQIFELQGAAMQSETDWGKADRLREAARKAAFAWGRLFSMAEAFNRRLTFAAAFQIGRGLPADKLRAAGVADAYEFAVKAVEETQGIYNRGNRPNWARGAVGATIFTFKQFSIAYIEFLGRLPRREKILALGVLVMAAGVSGLPGMDDLDDLIDTLAQQLGYSWNTKKERDEIIERAVAPIFGAGGAEFVRNGASAFLPIDVQARLGLGNLVPGTGIALKSQADKGREIAEAIGPAAGLVQGYFEGASKLLSGNIEGAIREAAPVAVQNAIKGIDMAQLGFYRDDAGRRVIDTDAADAAWKALGFQPATVAASSRARQAVRQDLMLNQVVESEIADLWAQGLFERAPDKIERARKRLADWNKRNPETPIRIVPNQIARRVKEMGLTADQRFLKRTSPELRARVAQEIAT